MAKRIFVAATKQNEGKTSTSLGLLAAFCEITDRLGFMTAPDELASLEQFLNLIPSAVDSVTSLAGFLASTISSVALTILLTLVIAIYLSIDARRFYRGVIALAPEAYQTEFRTLLIKIAHVWAAFFRGQITVSLILALITWLGATAVGLPGAFILALTAGVLALIHQLTARNTSAVVRGAIQAVILVVSILIFGAAVATFG